MTTPRTPPPGRGSDGSPHERPQRPTAPVWARHDRQPRRRTLTRHTIVAAAIELADRDGLEAVSIRSVATSLGVRPMSLYGHVSSKDDLLDLMFDELAGDTLLGERLPKHWREALEASARRTRDVGLAHPWTVELLVKRIQLGPNTLNVLDEWMRAVSPLAVRADTAWSIVTAVNDYTVGYVIRVCAQRRAVPTDAEAAREWMSSVSGYLSERADSGDHPHIGPLLRDGFGAQEDNFETGLSYLLDRIEDVHVGSRARRAPSPSRRRPAR